MYFWEEANYPRPSEREAINANASPTSTELIEKRDEQIVYEVDPEQDTMTKDERVDLVRREMEDLGITESPQDFNALIQSILQHPDQVINKFTWNEEKARKITSLLGGVGSSAAIYYGGPVAKRVFGPKYGESVVGIAGSLLGTLLSKRVFG